MAANPNRVLFGALAALTVSVVGATLDRPGLTPLASIGVHLMTLFLILLGTTVAYDSYPLPAKTLRQCQIVGLLVGAFGFYGKVMSETVASEIVAGFFLLVGCGVAILPTLAAIQARRTLQ